MIRKGTQVETEEGVRGIVVEVKRIDKAIRPDGDRLYTVRTTEGGELKFWGWQLRRAMGSREC